MSIADIALMADQLLVQTGSKGWVATLVLVRPSGMRGDMYKR